MSPLTKAFVVLVTILSILLVALVVPFVAKSDNYQQQIAQLEDSERSAQAAARIATQNLTELRNEQSADYAQLLAQQNELSSQYAAKVAQLEAMQADLKEARDQSDKLAAAQEILSQSLNKTAELLASRNTLLEGAQADNVQLNQEVTNLVRANTNLDARGQALINQNRILQEQVAMLEGQLDAVAAGQGVSTTEATAAATEVRGRVTGVDQFEGITLVQLNVGRSDQVSPDTQFVVYRRQPQSGETQFVGTAVVSTIEENVSVARMQTQRSTPAAGDQVITGIAY